MVMQSVCIAACKCMPADQIPTMAASFLQPVMGAVQAAAAALPAVHPVPTLPGQAAASSLSSQFPYIGPVMDRLGILFTYVNQPQAVADMLSECRVWEGPEEGFWASDRCHIWASKHDSFRSSPIPTCPLCFCFFHHDPCSAGMAVARHSCCSGSNRRAATGAGMPSPAAWHQGCRPGHRATAASAARGLGRALQGHPPLSLSVSMHAFAAMSSLVLCHGSIAHLTCFQGFPCLEQQAFGPACFLDWQALLI